MSDDNTIKKLEAILEKRQQHDFDEEEVEVLRRVIHTVRGLDALGSFAGFIRSTALWFGAVLGTILAIRNDWVIPIVEWIQTYLQRV